MDNKTFDILRSLAEIYLPTLATLVTAVGAIWSLPVAIPIVTTIVALNTAIGAVVKYKRSQHAGV